MDGAARRVRERALGGGDLPEPTARADVQSIVTSFRVYVLVEPEVHLVRAADAALDELWPGRQRGPHTHRSGELGASTAPEVWLYRGAWQEWPVTEATWLVPMSQEELRLKIQAIFKHQSQKDSMPFPGQDDREFWQRVEQRNKDTAAILDQLGLAEYFAMEAYVVD